MGCAGKRHIDTLTPEEEGWRRQLVNGTVDGRIPEGESMGIERSRQRSAGIPSGIAAGSRPLLVSHGIAPVRVSTILDYRHGLNVACVCATVLFLALITKVYGWRWMVAETAGDMDAPALDELQR